MISKLGITGLVVLVVLVTILTTGSRDGVLTWYGCMESIVYGLSVIAISGLFVLFAVWFVVLIDGWNDD